MAATVEVNLTLVFQNGELRLEEDESGWCGFRREERGGGIAYYYVDTRSPHTGLQQGVRVGERAVRETIRESLGNVHAMWNMDQSDRDRRPRTPDAPEEQATLPVADGGGEER